MNYLPTEASTVLICLQTDMNYCGHLGWTWSALFFSYRGFTCTSYLILVDFFPIGCQCASLPFWNIYRYRVQLSWCFVSIKKFLIWPCISSITTSSLFSHVRYFIMNLHFPLIYMYIDIFNFTTFFHILNKANYLSIVYFSSEFLNFVPHSLVFNRWTWHVRIVPITILILLV